MTSAQGNSNAHPEVIPNINGRLSDTFLFDITRSAEARKDLELQLEAYETRIERLVENTIVQGHHLLGYILKLSTDRRELEQLAAALQRVAPLAETYASLQERIGIMDAIDKYPDLLPWAYGSFDNEIDEITNISTTKDWRN